MTRTLAYPLVKELAHGWEKLYPSAVCSGIAPDAAHIKRGGYHVSRADNPHGNYSIVRRDDRCGCGPDDASAAIDMTLSRRDMILCTRRLIAVWENPDDPRRKYINAFNGWLGSGDPIRYDMVARRRSRASSDHTWHCHLEIRRRWITARAAVVAILSALAGDSIAQYLAKVGVTAAPAPRAAAPAAAGKGPQVPAYPGRILERDDRQAKPDPAVKAWQARMIARGWKSLGTADGRFGARTERVVRRFQAVCRLDVDGRIGPKTWPKPWTQPLAGGGK